MASSNYTARHLSVLEGLEAVRKRPGMYIGSTDSRGLMHCLWEIIDNSVDEALAGFGQSIQVILYRDGSVEVRDDGRGIPTDIEPRTACPVWRSCSLSYTPAVSLAAAPITRPVVCTAWALPW